MVTLRNYNVPEDTINEIIIRLPVKTLMRFKCVSKNWNVLVESSSFCLKHFKSYNDDNARLVVSYQPFDNDTNLNYSLCLFQDETLEDLLSHEELTHQMPVNGYALGLHLGIFCLLENNIRMTLWNVATREYRTLPKCRAAIPRYMGVRHTNIGFGFDLISNDCKFVLIRSLWGADYSHEHSHVALYCLRTNTWTGIKGNEFINYQVEHQYDGTYLDGVCYWLAYANYGEEYLHQFVLAFHMADEIFQEIERPTEISVLTMTFLGLCNDLLAYLVFNRPDSFMDIWVRKGILWSRHLHVGPIPVVTWPLGFWKDDLFFIESNSQELLLFDPSTKTLTDVGLRTCGFRVYKYKESLITVKETNCMLEDNDIPWHVLGVESG